MKKLTPSEIWTILFSFAFVDSFSMVTVLFMLQGRDTWRCLNWSPLLRVLIFYTELFELLMYLLLKDLGIFPNK